MNVCFLAAAEVEAEGVGPAPAAAAETGSRVTALEDMGCTMARWKRVGMEWESWVVVGRMRRADEAENVQCLEGAYRGYVARTNLDGGSRRS